MLKNFSLFLFILLATYSSVSAKEKYFKNIYEYGVYNSYLSQLKVFVEEQMSQSPHIKKALEDKIAVAQNEFQKKGLAWIESLQTVRFDSPESLQLFHNKMILGLRSLIQEKQRIGTTKDPLTDEISGFIDNFCSWLFTIPNLNDEMEGFIKTVQDLSPQITQEKSPHGISGLFKEIYEKSLKDSRFDLDSEKGVLEDAHADGDVTTLLFTLNNKAATKIIRTPNAARDTSLNPITLKTGSAQVNEEFFNYLANQSKKGQKHLYINLMKRRSEEGIKTALIETLEKDPRVESALSIVTLDRNSDSAFYMQNGPFLEPFQADEFKKNFLSEMFFEKGDYYWSHHLDKQFWKNYLVNLVEQIHCQYLGNKEQLSLQERKDFIEITHVKIIETLIDHLQPNVVNMTCKHSIDRGPSLFSLFYFYEMHKAGQSNIMRTAAFFFAPSLLNHNRPAHAPRVARFQSAANLLLISNFE